MNNPTKKPPGVIPVGKRTLRETREASPQAPTNPSPSGAESEPSVTAKKKVARPAVAILIAFALSVFSALGAATTNRPGVISPGSTSNPNAAYQIQANAAGYFTNPTNANLGSADIGVIYVDSIVGSDSTGTGTSWKPYATLTKAQTVAINGQTIYGVRGTFAENSLGKNGVSWYFNDGVFLSSSGAFSVGTNNGVTNLTDRKSVV